MAQYSHSRLSTFENCRMQYKFHYIDKLPTEQEHTIETFLGGLVHETLEKLYKDLQHEKRDSIEDLLKFFTDEWTARYDPKTVSIVKDEYTQEHYRALGERMIRDYYARHQPFRNGRTLGLETEELLTLDEGVEYHVRIDRLVDQGNGVYEIHDYKTNSSMKTQEELEADRQLAMYALWVHQAFPDARRVRLVWHFLAFDKDMVVEKRIEDLAALKQTVLGLIGEVNECKDYPPRVSALCDWCAYQRACPAWKHKFATEQLAPEQFSREEGVAMANEYAALDEEAKLLGARLEELKEKLFAYGQQHGVTAVYGSNVRATLWSKQGVAIPGKADPEQARIVAELKDLGLYPQYVMLDAWKLEKDVSEGRVQVSGLGTKTVRKIYLAKR